MEPLEIIAQAVGIVAMVFNILSYQGKKQSTVITLQLFGASLFAINFFMLGATVGGIMNLMAAFRAIVFVNKKRFKAESVWWLIIFITMFVTAYVLTFTVFGKTFTPINALIELLPIIAMTVSTIGFRNGSAKAIRYWGLIGSPSWLVYNICNFAIGAIICEVVSLISIIVGIIRYDIKKK